MLGTYNDYMMKKSVSDDMDIKDVPKDVYNMFRNGSWLQRIILTVGFGLSFYWFPNRAPEYRRMGGIAFFLTFFLYIIAELIKWKMKEKPLKKDHQQSKEQQ